jgi:AmmeMemoRadiSam system protein B
LDIYAPLLSKLRISSKNQVFMRLTWRIYGAISFAPPFPGNGQFFKKCGFPLHPALPDTNINYVERVIALGERIRCPVVDGLFYPEDEAGVLAYMRGIGLKRGKGGHSGVIIAPHGAWGVSGGLAGAAFDSAAGRTGAKAPARVVIAGPVHDKRTEGLFLSNSHVFTTPLGDVPVDLDSVGRLESCSPFFEVNDIPHLQEHSIEVLLPFVKYCFPRTSIVPILMGKPKEQYIRALAGALGEILTPVMENTLPVISFNMAVHQGEEEALNMAGECVKLVTEGKYTELTRALQSGQIVSCGGDLVAALLQSGLVDRMNPKLASPSLQSAPGEKGRTIYYGACSFD